MEQPPVTEVCEWHRQLFICERLPCMSGIQGRQVEHSPCVKVVYWSRLRSRRGASQSVIHTHAQRPSLFTL